VERDSLVVSSMSSSVKVLVPNIWDQASSVKSGRSSTAEVTVANQSSNTT